MTSHPRDFQWRSVARLPASIAVLYAVVSIGFQAYEYIGYALFNDPLFFDAAEKWLPIAKQLSNGAALYTETLFDNKSPLWHALNYLVYQTGAYVPVWFLLVAIANAAIAVLLYYWLKRSGYAYGGVIAGFLYLATIPFTNADVINVRSFSLAFLLLAIMFQTAWKRGLLTAIAVLFSQVTAFAIPVLLIDGLLQSRNRGRWLVIYGCVGAMAAALAYLPLLFWGPSVLVAAVQQTMLSAGEYVISHNDVGNPVQNPVSYIRLLLSMGRSLAFLLVPAGAAVLHHYWRTDFAWDTFGMAFALTICLGATLALKSLAYYWMPPVMASSAIVGIELQQWIREHS